MSTPKNRPIPRHGSGQNNAPVTVSRGRPRKKTAEPAELRIQKRPITARESQRRSLARRADWAIRKGKRLPPGEVVLGCRIGVPYLVGSPAELETALHEYLQYCIESDTPCTQLGFVCWLGAGPHYLHDLIHAELSAQQDRQGQDRGALTYTSVVQKLRMCAENWAEIRLMTGKGGNTVGLIFALKNRFGWVDRQEIAVDGPPVEINIIVDGVNNGDTGESGDIVDVS